MTLQIDRYPAKQAALRRIVSCASSLQCREEDQGKKVLDFLLLL